MDEEGKSEVRHVTGESDRMMDVDGMFAPGWRGRVRETAGEVGRGEAPERRRQEEELVDTLDRLGRYLEWEREKELLAACAQIEREQEAERLKAIVAGLVRTGSGHPQVEAFAHVLYEIHARLAPGFGYEIQGAPWEEVPEEDRNLMIATCVELLARRVVVWNGGVAGTWKAKDLPVGSVVSSRHTTWIKSDSGGWAGAWTLSLETNDEIDKELVQGAKVLRVGDGE